MPDPAWQQRERWETRRWARTPGQRGGAAHLIHPDKPGAAECDGRELGPELPASDRSPGCRACLDVCSAREHREHADVHYGRDPGAAP